MIKTHKKLWILLIFSFMMGGMIGCHTPMAKDNFELLNGYWEIKSVTLANGNHKDYGMNPTIDYIEIKGFKGFRKKMQPNLSGSFQTSDDAAFFYLDSVAMESKMHYTKGNSQWVEILLEVNSKSFSTRDLEGNIYYYQRFEPINLN